MPREKTTTTVSRARPPAVIPTVAMVASAVRFPGKMKRVYNNTDKEWQRECYRHYRICGEARFAARFYGHAVSRALLNIVTPGDKGAWVAQTEGESVAALDDLFKGRDGQAQMLEAIGVHLTIAGECYLVGRKVVPEDNDEDNLGGDIWEIVSITEMHVNGSTWTIRHDGYRTVDLTENDVVIRIWNPDPAERMRADSPFKSLLPVLTEIEYLTRHIFSQTTSRLAGAGILFMNQDVTFPPPPPVNGEAPQFANQAEQSMAALAHIMMQSIKDPGNAAGVVPIVATVPGEALKGDAVAKLMHFWSDLDEKALQMRSNAIYRFASGMDLPVEQVMGMSQNPGTGGGKSNGVSHWGAWQVEEATIKMWIEPTLELIVNALTIGYLRPLLAAGAQDKVGYTTEPLRLRPDRSKEATVLNAAGIIKDEVVARENGFKPEDIMGAEDVKVWLLRKIASGSATPEQVAAAAAVLGVDIPSSTSAPQGTRESRPAPSMEGLPNRDRMPEMPQAAALLPAYESMALRALERAGNRIRTDFGGVGPDGVRAHEMHTIHACNGSSERYLKDAFAHAEVVLDGQVDDPEAVVGKLRAYCLSLMASQQPHSRARLASFMEVV